MLTPINDNGCGWTNLLEPRTASNALTTDLRTQWLIIGAGYTGLSAARQLSALRPNDEICLIDAQRAGEGASARNSGYLVDSTLNDGHLSDAGLVQFQKKYELNRLALKRVERFVEQFQVDCDWNPCGKFHAAASSQYQQKLTQFSDILHECQISHRLLNKDALSARLGIDFYHGAVHTDGGVLLQPAKLSRAMINALPDSIKFYENSPVHSIETFGNQYKVLVNEHTITTDKLLLCTNGFLPALGVAQHRVFPLTLTASLTRPLTNEEFEQIGRPEEWGVLSAQSMGATVRFTQDRRIMIRNTAEAIAAINMNPDQLRKRIVQHKLSLARRFPMLKHLRFDHSWSGVTCISRNSANLFQKYHANAYVAGCYNGGGIGLATLFGEELANYAVGETSEAITRITERPQPARLPPNPFLRWGVKLRLADDRRKSVFEI